MDVILGVAGLVTGAALAAITDPHPTARASERDALNSGLSRKRVLVNKIRSFFAKLELTAGFLICALGIWTQFVR